MSERWFALGTRSPYQKLLAYLIAVIMAAGFLVVAQAPQPASAAIIDDTAEYVLVNRHSGLVADVLNASQANGADIVQYRRTDAPWQRWRFVDSGDGYFRIVSVHSGRAIDVWEAATTDGAFIRQYSDGNSTNQQFRAVDTAGGVQLINRRSGKALEVWEWSTSELGRLSQYTSHGGASQVWDLVRVSEPLAECGTGAFTAEVVKSGATWIARRGSRVAYTGTDMLAAMTAGLSLLDSGRDQKQRVVIRGSGEMAANTRLRVGSFTTLDVCGTITVTGAGASDHAPIYARGATDIEIQHLTVVGTPIYGIFMRNVDNVTLRQVSLDLQGTGHIGVRIDNHGGDRSVKSTGLRIGDVRVTNATGHGVETYGIDGVTIGTVTVRNVGGSGLLLNDSINADVGIVDAIGAGTGSGYAALRFANANGRINGGYPSNVHVQKVIAHGGGRGIFCVSQSGGAVIDEIEISGTASHSILIENCYGVHIGAIGGTVDGPGRIRLAARSEFPNNRDVTIENLTVRDTVIDEMPCAERSTFRNLRLVNSSMNVCAG